MVPAEPAEPAELAVPAELAKPVVPAEPAEPAIPVAAKQCAVELAPVSKCIGPPAVPPSSTGEVLLLDVTPLIDGLETT